MAAATTFANNSFVRHYEYAPDPTGLRDTAEELYRRPRAQRRGSDGRIPTITRHRSALRAAATGGRR